MKILKKSPAKINLGLQVCGKRNDGFHEINSVFVPVSLADEIVIEKSNENRFSCKPDLSIEDQKNLAWKARQLFCEYYSNCPQTDISIMKKIPAAGGLGGGSSNAGTTLLALNQLTGNPLQKNELLEISAKIGSDVPFFIDPQTSLIRGRGEKIIPLSIKLDYSVVVVAPGIDISTPWAYRILNKSEKISEALDYSVKLKESIANPEKFMLNFRNDFEDAIFSEFPIIRKIKEQLLESGAFYASMSGSGSTVFGFFKSEEQSQMAYAIFSDFNRYHCHTI